MANVVAGTYSLKAIATDKQGGTGTSSVISVTVSTVIITDDIIGASCAKANDIKTYNLNTLDMVNATSYSWWCTGSTQSVTPVSGQPQNVTINFGPWFTGGQACIGVNYSVSPWYKQFCKNVTLCTTSARIGFIEEQSPIETGVGMVYPNPSTEDFTFVADKTVRKITVNTVSGVQQNEFKSIAKGQKVLFGKSYNTGIYLVNILYEDSSQNTIKIIKQQ